MKRSFLFIFSVIIGSSFVNAQSWRVNNIPGIDVDFTTLAAAVTASSAGDTIYVESSPNNYTGSVSVNKRLTIFGTGYFLSDTANHNTQWNQNLSNITGTITMAPGSSGSIL